MKNLPKILTYTIVAITAVVFVYFALNMQERVGTFLVWAYILFGLATLLVVVLPLFNIASNPQALKKSAINLGFMIVVFGIAFLLASGAQTSVTEAMLEPPSFATMKITDMGLKATYILFVIAFLAILFSSAISAIRNR